MLKISRHPISLNRPIGESEDSYFGDFIEDVLKTLTDRLPPLAYPAGSITRRIQSASWISYRSSRILIGKGLAGYHVRLEEHPGELRIFYADHAIRRLASDDLNKDTVL